MDPATAALAGSYPPYDYRTGDEYRPWGAPPPVSAWQPSPALPAQPTQAASDRQHEDTVSH